jgi:2-hydroxychromene-2-carboxylate isomerase
MSRQIEVFYSLTSPWTYLGWPRLCEIAATAAALLVPKPVVMGDVFKATGGLPLAQRPPARRAYRLMELARWQRRLGMPLVLEPRHFPTSDAMAARMVIALRQMGGDAQGLSFALLRACWAEERDLADMATLAAIAGERGLDAQALLERAQAPETAARYAADTRDAIDRGVFGAPTFILGQELFWGQDRLDFLAEALAG